MAAVALVATAAVATPASGEPGAWAQVGAAAVPAGFTDRVELSGLNLPTSVAFAPDGRVFVAEKNGIVKQFDSLDDPTPSVFADLRTNVHDYVDRGLLGITVDPQFPARPFVYVVYTYDALPGGSAPQWGDRCPAGTPCVVQARVSKLVASADLRTGTEVPLVTGWCQQFGSHSIGTVLIGPDGALYAGAGEGASYNYADYGQTGNPCGDPPLPAGTNLTLPNAQGGALRSQSPRRAAAQPRTLSGTIIRVDPDTGAGLPGNPFFSSSDQNARRIIAYGMRNPFRFTGRPGTEQLWVGDVGWNLWEEIDRIADVNDGVAENFGWPCYEGNVRQPAYDDLGVSSCESLYPSGGTTAPYYAYHQVNPVVAGDNCPGGQAALSGIAFEDGSNYPAAYDGGVFFADVARGCIWVMRQGTNGQPNPANVTPFLNGATSIVQVLTGPGGDIYYLDIATGSLRRIVYNGANHPPTAVPVADPTGGESPLTVRFDAGGSTDLDPGDTLSFAWDLDGDGAFDDSAAVAPSHTYTGNGTRVASLRVTDNHGAFDVQTVTIVVGPPNAPPVPVIDSPTSDLRWRVGDPIAFSGRASDAEDGALGPSRLTWSLVLNHCPGGCHIHPMQEFAGTASGSFTAPDHEYPVHLSLVLTATDSSGARASTSVRLDPTTVDLTLATAPAGLQVSVNNAAGPSPLSREVIARSNNGVSAPGPQTLGGTVYAFDRWSDSGAASHNVTVGDTASTLTATYRQVVAGCPATPSGFHTIPTPAGPPGATTLKDGRVAFAVLGGDSQLYLAAQDISAPPIRSGPLECYGGNATDQPAIAAGPASVGLFVRSADNRIFQRHLTSGSNGSWTVLAGATTNGPGAVVTDDGITHLVVRGTNGAVYHATRSGTTWSGWENLGGGIVGTPSVAALPGGRVAIVARAPNNGIYARLGKTGSWSAWSRIPGETLTEPTVAAGYTAGRLDLFVAGTAGGMYQSTLVNGAWTAFARRETALPAGSQIAAAASAGKIVVFAASGGASTTRQYVAGGSWSVAPTAYACPTCAPGGSAIGAIR